VGIMRGDAEHRIDRERAIGEALDYHERTKHRFDRFARSAGYLDWANEPDPFRRFEGAPLLPLPVPDEDRTPAYDRLFAPGPAPGPAPALALDRRSLSEFLYYSLAISAWKSFQGASWALRVNPSSGNLHPTEGYLLLPPIRGIGERAGVSHYAPREHALERRAEINSEAWKMLTGELPSGSFLVGLTSIRWREAWKYGERAYRYCAIDAGHALAGLRIAAAALGWTLRAVFSPSSSTLASLFGVDRAADFDEAEREDPEMLAVVRPGPADPARGDPAFWNPPPETVRGVFASGGAGIANRLSREPIVWEAIDRVAAACRRRTDDPPLPAGNAGGLSAPSPLRSPERATRAGALIRGRRSAVAMDGRTAMTREAFHCTLDRLLPRRATPWDALCWPPQAHLLLFVHRVEGIEPGLYALPRDPQEVGSLRAALRSEFLWTAPAGTPDGLPLFLLAPGDFREVAGALSCGQAIAADGAFSAAIVARFEPALRAFGASFYPRLFQEAGAIGQMLYLEAEAAGLRGTGIGCFFDDPVHEVFGIRNRYYQSLYHFTVGAPVHDPRLTTLPAYPQHADPSSAPGDG